MYEIVHKFCFLLNLCTAFAFAVNLLDTPKNVEWRVIVHSPFVKSLNDLFYFVSRFAALRIPSSAPAAMIP